MFVWLTNPDGERILVNINSIAMVHQEFEMPSTTLEFSHGGTCQIKETPTEVAALLETVGKGKR